MHERLIEGLDVFRGLGETAQARLVAGFVSRTVASSEVVFREGDEPDAFYVVADGRLVAFRDAVGKPMQLLSRYGPGDFFGEMGLFDDGKRSISIRAIETCKLLRIAKTDLLTFLDDHPVAAIRLQMVAARRHSENAAASLELGARRDLRIRVDADVLLTLEDGRQHQAVLSNLSFGGLCLDDAPVDWHREAVVHFRLGKGEEAMRISGRVVWKSDDGTSAGIAFLDLDDDHDLRVSGLLRSLIDRR